MSFTDQKQFIATEEDCNFQWGGGKNGSKFRCYLCGHKFKVGDKVRWVYAGHKKVINFFTCDKCDGTDVVDRFVALNKSYQELKKKFWWKA